MRKTLATALEKMAPAGLEKRTEKSYASRLEAIS
jgi:hypothetical protein